MNIVTELIIDAYDCALDLSDAAAIEKAARDAVLSVGAQIAESVCHRFQPHGLTLCLVLKESHFIVSTWPELRMAIVNVFLCNDSMDTRDVWKKFSTALKPTRVVFHEVKHEIESAQKAA